VTLIFGDLIGKLDVLHVACDKCWRKGRYAVARLIEQCGYDAKVVDWRAEIKSARRKRVTGRI
jgi:hypothetical protein